MKTRTLNPDFTPYMGSITDLERREHAHKVKKAFDSKKLEKATKELEKLWIKTR